MSGQKIRFVAAFLFCCTPWASASVALLLGLVMALIWRNPFERHTSKWGGYLLKTSVVGLGFGINMQVLLQSGQDNVGITACFVFGVLGTGYFLGKLLKINRLISLLVSVGTAICGGSAIAAVGSVLKADANQLSMATGVVFLLNALALFIFPTLGHWAGLSQEEFGTWAAIAIHDTSSVVGAAAKYGDEALRVASITKMLRILWIIPVSLALVLRFADNLESFKIPSFIIGFVVASCLFSFVPAGAAMYRLLYPVAKQGLVASLFLIGSGISLDAVRQVGAKVLLQAVSLWVVVSIVALLYVKYA
ncbi:MAG: putative sulfate exporter family transporter [Spirosomaceae bacterium]|jgi:uncharacterized integral membrane protein (TIGR00698 family)|nr:putative sulfate exporter family transporter [Spirosomataceae bacterium]